MGENNNIFISNMNGDTQKETLAQNRRKLR
jgi:hypothetical protein